MPPVKKCHDNESFNPFFGVNLPTIQGLVQSKMELARAYAKEMVYGRSNLAERQRRSPNMDDMWWAVDLFVLLIPSIAITAHSEWTRSNIERCMRETEEREKRMILGGFGGGSKAEVEEEAFGLQGPDRQSA